MSDVTVTRNEGASRFEARVGEELAGIAEYVLRDGVYVFPHTVVDPRFGGQGVGTTLVRTALDEVRDENATMIPSCSFVAAFVDKNPEYRNLVADPRR